MPHLALFLLQFAGMRKEYVSLYSEHLRSPIDPARPRDRLPKGIVDMDRELPEQTIVMFRRAFGFGRGSKAGCCTW